MLHNAKCLPRIQIILAYTGSQKLAKHPNRDLSDLLDELNSPTELADFVSFSLGDIHKAISGLARPEKITFELLLSEWGHIQEPYKSFYGYSGANDIANLWKDYGDKILAKNIRKFLGDTDINGSIQSTLTIKPENFWYFNNGITILCESIQKTPHGGSSRNVGMFKCSGASIVNGAQTVGNIGRAYIQNGELVEKAKLMVRIISLEGSSEEFGIELTRATNTQNKIERKDFVSLDKEQERLRTEIHIEMDKTYLYKSGEQKTRTEEECTLEEATVALACSSGDLNYAILSKKEIGKLWEDIKQPPYTDLFNPQLTGRRLWNLIQVYREVENRLKQVLDGKQGPQRSIAVHGNRFILFEVFSKMKKEEIELGTQETIIENVKKRTIELTDYYYEKTCDSQTKLYPEAVIGRMFYNKEKWQKMHENVSEEKVG